MDEGKPANGPAQGDLCFYCERKHGDPGCEVPVLIRGGWSEHGYTKYGVVIVPRCERCKSLHILWISGIGWNYVGRLVGQAVLMIPCIYLITWRFSRLGDKVSPATLWYWCLPLALVLINVWWTERRFDPVMMLSRRNTSVKPPGAFQTFPPLVKLISSDLCAYVSPYYLYANWHTLFSIVGGLLSFGLPSPCFGFGKYCCTDTHGEFMEQINRVCNLMTDSGKPKP